MKVDSRGLFHDQIYFTGDIPIGKHFFLDCGALIEADIGYAAAFASAGIGNILDFLALKMRGTYNFYPGKDFSELAAIGTVQVYNDFLEFEAGLGLSHLYNILFSGQSINSTSWVYRLKWTYLELDMLSLAAELSNLEDFQLNNISDITLSLINRFRINPDWAAELQLSVHNTGAWVFSSFYSGFDLSLAGVYSL